MATPSSYRRDGRRAFIPYEDPADHYNTGSRHYIDFVEGWEQARRTHEAEEKERGETAAKNLPFETLRDEIAGRISDPVLRTLLDDMLDLIETVRDGGE